MYCGNCGKEIKDNSKFCPYCRDKNTIANSNANKGGSAFQIKEYNISSIYDTISMILILLLMFRFISMSISRYEGNMDAFEWVDDSARTIGIIFHWGILLIIISSCAEYISKFLILRKKVDALICIRTGIGLFVDGLILGIGRMIFDDYNWTDSMSIVYYRIFGTYRELIGMTIVVAIIVIACGILRQKNK